MYILIAILLLGILVIVHEAGHFFAARLTGIEVQEFAVGFGPKLFGWTGKKHGTRFSLRLIPLGGFCAFYGEDDAEGKHQDDPRAYNKQSVWKRMLTVVMGPCMNFILAFAVLVGYYCAVGTAVVDPILNEVIEGGPAYVAGLRNNDLICEIDGEDVRGEGTAATLRHLQAWKDGDKPLHIVCLRGGETVEADVTPVYSEADGRYMISIIISGTLRVQENANGKISYATQRMPLGESISTSAQVCVQAGTAILDVLRQMVTTGEGLDETSGPVGVVTLVSREVQEGGFDAFINLLVFISINLGVMNLLPIPGLDGSRFLFQVIEVVRRKPVRQEREAMVHLIGMAFLFALMIFFTYRDVMKLFR